MQSVLHDLDVGLPNLRSFAAHEDALYKQVIPVIQDTFESYDEESAKVLQSFFWCLYLGCAVLSCQEYTPLAPSR